MALQMTILMIRPAHFEYNDQTAVNNTFQRRGDQGRISDAALAEFDGFVCLLRRHDIDVLVVQDTAEPHTPDSIFPNNWISFHEDGTVVLYPMFAKNRRLERKPAVLDAVRQRFFVSRTIDYSHHEGNNRFLEGTGSFVLDRSNRVAYACRSARTDEALFEDFCKRMGYRSIIFDAFDSKSRPVYHTNVMLCIADHYAVINLSAILPESQTAIVDALEGTGKEVITITHDQMQCFAGNMLQVENQKGKRFLVLSSGALQALLPLQIDRLQSYNPLIHAPLDTIEQNGGGSARCMMAEMFLPTKMINSFNSSHS